MGKKQSCPALTPEDGPSQDWQSSGVRRVSFLSLMYFSAAAFTMGLMIWSSACMNSELKFHFAPSHVCTRAQLEPM